jgi:hypothetical protein
MPPAASDDDAYRTKALRDLWRRTLSQVPTTFGQIVYLASLRDANSGRYQHFGLAQVYSPNEANEALAASHLEVFGEWLNYPLARQQEDLEAYLASLDEDRGTVLRAWAKLSPYRNLVPAGASEAQRTLFEADLELILDLLRAAFLPSAPNPGA